MRARTRVRDQPRGGFPERPSRGGSSAGSSCLGRRAGRARPAEGAGPSEAAAVRGAAATGRRRDRDPDPAPRAEPSTRSAAKFRQLCPPLSEGARGPGRRERAGRGAGRAAPGAPGPAPPAPAPRGRRPRLPARRRRRSAAARAAVLAALTSLGGLKFLPSFAHRSARGPAPRPAGRGASFPRAAPRSLLPSLLPPPPSTRSVRLQARPPLRPLPLEAPVPAGPPRRRRGTGAAGGRGDRAAGAEVLEGAGGRPRGPALPLLPPSGGGAAGGALGGGARNSCGLDEPPTTPATLSKAKGAQDPSRPAHNRGGGDRGAENTGAEGTGRAAPPPGSPSFPHTPQPRGDPGKLSHTPLSLTLTTCVRHGN